MSMGAEIRARMSLDASGVKAGVQQAKGHVSGFGNSLKGMAGSLGISFAGGVAAAALIGIVKLTKASIEMALRTKDMAAQTGLTVEQFQAFQATAMEMTGGLKAAEVGLVAFRTAQDDALSGNKTTIDAFKKLGVSLEDIANKSTPQLLEAVAKGYQSIGDFGALVDLFGKKNASKLEEALITLADNGFGQLESKTTKAGLVLGDEFSARLDQAGDAIDRLKLRAEVLWDKLLLGGFKAFQRLAAIRKGMVEYGSSFLSDLFDTKQGFSFGEMAGRAEAAAQKTLKTETEKTKNDDKMFRQERKQAREKDEERSAKLRKSKIGEIYAAEAEEAKKVEEKKTEEADKAREKKLAAEQAAAEKLAEKAAAAAGVSVTELRGSGAEQFQRRFDSLRQIGANVLGSGKIGSPANQQAELVSLAKQTADNTARLVQQQNSPPLSRIANSTAIF